MSTPGFAESTFVSRPCLSCCRLSWVVSWSLCRATHGLPPQRYPWAHVQLRILTLSVSRKEQNSSARSLCLWLGSGVSGSKSCPGNFFSRMVDICSRIRSSLNTHGHPARSNGKCRQKNLSLPPAGLEKPGASPHAMLAHSDMVGGVHRRQQ